MKPTIRKSSGVSVVLVRVVSMLTRRVCVFEPPGIKPWAGRDVVAITYQGQDLMLCVRPTELASVRLRGPGPSSPDRNEDKLEQNSLFIAAIATQQIRSR